MRGGFHFLILQGFSQAMALSGIDSVITLPAPMITLLPMVTPGNIIMRCDSDSGKKLIKSMVLRTADRQGMC